ncbi:MAG TPA: YqgE/AlgH family protein [Nocardioidaceae bacterium]|nr:YqgE/AlgH family protein [Nocardioidaceae bacterium]
MPEARPSLEAGRILVATPSLLDPNFARTVVLLLDVDDNGALGVVLNRPSQVPVGEVLPGWSETAAEPPVLFSGGPVSPDSALAVAALAGADEDAEPVGFRKLYGEVGIVDLDTPPQLLAPALTQLRIFAGYAGWGTGQLLEEIEQEAWYVVPSLRADLFGTDAEGLWRRVLRRQPGEMAWASTRPLDPTMN